MIVKAQAGCGGGVGTQLYHGPIAGDQDVFDLELHAPGQYPVEPREGVSPKILLRSVTPRQWMGAFHRPIHLVRDMLEKPVSGAGFQVRKDAPDRVH